MEVTAIDTLTGKLPVSVPGEPKTAFVLGGGGNLGAVQVGMMRALFEHGIRPDLLLGCSAGALNAAAIAENPTIDGVLQLDRTWAEIKSDEVFPGLRFISPWLLLRRGPSICPNDGLRALIERSLELRRFEEARVPFEVVATELATGRARWFDCGDVIDPILASTAIPGVLPPVRVGNELYIDGGVVENVPIDRTRHRACSRVVVLHVGNFERQRPRTERPIDIVLHSFAIARNYDFLRESSRMVNGVEVIVVPSIDPGPLKRNDFSHGRDLSRRAFENASRYLSSYLAAAPSA